VDFIQEESVSLHVLAYNMKRMMKIFFDVTV